MPTHVRRRALPLLALTASAALLLSACSSDSGDAPTGTETRTVTSEVGESTIPVDPQMIVALDEPAALNMLSIGITPDVVFDSWRTTVPKAILESAGIEMATTSSFYPELEEVAAFEPDLIVGTAAEGFAESGPAYASIAPLIGALYAEADGSQIIEAYGEYFDRPAEAARVSDALDALAEEAAAAQPAGETSISVLMSWAQDNMPLYMDAANSLHGTIAAAGFTRPPLQDEVPAEGSAFGGWTVFSPEQLPAQDADVLAIAVAAQYNLEGITEMPLYPSLAAVTNDRSLVVDGDLWSGGAAFYTYWVLRDLATIAASDDAPGTVDDGAERWNDYLTAIGG